MEISGTLTANATLTKIGKDKQVVNFNIALNESYRTKNGEIKERTQFVRCAYWLGSGVTKILTKGTAVSVFGWMTTSAWMGSDGQPKAALNLNTSKIKVLGRVQKNPLQLVTEGYKAPDKPADDLPF